MNKGRIGNSEIESEEKKANNVFLCLLGETTLGDQSLVIKHDKDGQYQGWRALRNIVQKGMSSYESIDIKLFLGKSPRFFCIVYVYGSLWELRS